MKINGMKCNFSFEVSVESIEIEEFDYEGMAKADNLIGKYVSDIENKIMGQVHETVKEEVKQAVKESKPSTPTKKEAPAKKTTSTKKTTEKRGPKPKVTTEAQ